MRVKKLMKEEADVKAVAGDASYAAARATVSSSPMQAVTNANEDMSVLCFRRVTCREDMSGLSIPCTDYCQVT